MKSKRSAPPRFFHLWRHRHGNRIGDFTWKQRLSPRSPKYLNDWLAMDGADGIFIRVEDLKTGEIKSNFGLREAAWFATHDWPKRKAALAAVQKFYAPKPPVDPLKRRQKRLADLRRKEKNWTRKLKLATTKLKKIKAAIKRHAALCLGRSQHLHLSHGQSLIRKLSTLNSP